jgi:hypothetical protein
MKAIVIERFEDKDTHVQYQKGDILFSLSEERFNELLDKGKVELLNKQPEIPKEEPEFVTPKKAIKKGKK